MLKKPKGIPIKIPPGYSEDEVINLLYTVSRRLAAKFKFGYLDYDDLVQTGVMYGIRGLRNYKAGTGPLENFLYIHIRNRLFNYKRDNYFRPEKPCENSCPIRAWIKKDDSCKEFENKSDCVLYAKWEQRTNQKKNVMNTLAYEQVRSEGESNFYYEPDFGEDIDRRAMMEKIERELPVEYLESFQRITMGLPISKADKAAVVEKIREIIGGDLCL